MGGGARVYVLGRIRSKDGWGQGGIHTPARVNTHKVAHKNYIHVVSYLQKSTAARPITQSCPSQTRVLGSVPPLHRLWPAPLVPRATHMPCAGTTPHSRMARRAATRGCRHHRAGPARARLPHQPTARCRTAAPRRAACPPPPAALGKSSRTPRRPRTPPLHPRTSRSVHRTWSPQSGCGGCGKRCAWRAHRRCLLGTGGRPPPSKTAGGWTRCAAPLPPALACPSCTR
mmetsp:Transcript_27770/g.69598  ORF Transcript_27770/g.69598 Transcript_27770/m.69598 type:complete len:229 (+) Transcript_27770:41-727(+)